MFNIGFSPTYASINHKSVMQGRVVKPGLEIRKILVPTDLTKESNLTANEMAIQDAEAEPPMIGRAKAYIAGLWYGAVGLAHGCHRGAPVGPGCR